MTHRTLSTTAFRTYWLGRYLERAGSTARLVSVNANLLIDLPVRFPLGWLPLVDILKLSDEFEELYGDARKTHSASLDAHEWQVVRFLLSDTRNSGSLLSALGFARENARTLRGTLPRAAYEHINEAHLYAKDALQEPLSRSRRYTALDHVVERLLQIEGFLSSSMLHNASWQFLRLGSFIERADMTTRIVDLRTNDLLEATSGLDPFEDIQWRSVLNSLDAMQGYTVTVQRPVNQADALQYLLQDPALPRSLLRCYTALRNGLRGLPRNEVPLKKVQAMRQQLKRARTRNLQGEKLHRFVDTRQKQLLTLHQIITNTYFPSA
jgi:uncharacterized alpha-E superfamily protein